VISINKIIDLKNINLRINTFYFKKLKDEDEYYSLKLLLEDKIKELEKIRNEMIENLD
jgi:hypothetical protein